MMPLAVYAANKRGNKPTPPAGGGGGGSLPSWVPGTVGQWVQISGTEMANVAPSPSPPGSATNKIDAWTSFAIDERTSDIYSVANGGHLDYAGNEVDKLVLETESPGWTQLRAPTANAQIPAASAQQDYYNDGRPASRHSYYGQTFDVFTGSGRVMLWGGGFWSDPGRLSAVSDTFNLNTNDYSAAGTIPNVPSPITDVGGAFAVGVDPRNGNHYFFGGYGIMRWNVGTSGSFTTITSTGGLWAYNAVCAWDSARNRFLVVGGPDAAHHTFDGTTLSAITLSGAQQSTVATATASSMVYVPSLDAFLMRLDSSGGTIYQINASTFACTTFSTTGGSSIPATQNGPYYKFLYAPNLKCCIYIPTYTGNAWALRVEA